MKSLLLAVCAIGVPLGLMLIINWVMSGAAPQATPVIVRSSPRAQPPAVAPRENPARDWPVELAPAGKMLPLPAEISPRRHGDTEQSPGTGQASPASAPAAAPTIADRIELWLEDWQQRTQARPDSQREAAALALARGDFERAAVAFDRLLLENPNDADLTMGEVMALTRLGRHEDALPLLTALVEREPGNAAARYHSGVTLTRLGRCEEAMATFSKLLELCPDHEAAMYNLAVLQQSLGHRQNAWTTWRKLTEHLPAGQVFRSTEPGGTPARPPRSPPLARGGNMDDTPTPPPEGSLGPELACAAWFHRGEAEMAMSQVKDAQKCFLEVTRRAPEDARGWCNLGIARAVLAEYDEAMPALMAALRLEPNLVAAMNQLAYIHAVKYRDTGLPEDRQAVLDWCSRSLAVRSQQPNIIELRGVALDVTTQPEPDEPTEAPAEDEPALSPIHARP